MQSPSPKSLSVDICLSACLCLFVCTASSMVVECSAALHFCTVRHYNFVQCGTILLCNAALYFQSLAVLRRNFRCLSMDGQLFKNLLSPILFTNQKIFITDENLLNIKTEQFRCASCRNCSVFQRTILPFISSGTSALQLWQRLYRSCGQVCHPLYKQWKQ